MEQEDIERTRPKVVERVGLAAGLVLEETERGVESLDPSCG